MRKLLACSLILFFLFAPTVLCAGNENAKAGTNQPSTALTPVSPVEFGDILGHWAKSEIEKVCRNGLMSGMGANKEGRKVFSPDTVVNRAQLASVLQRTFQLDYGQLRFVKQPVVSDYYQDVAVDAWYANAAVICAINEIFADSNTFKPNQSVSRIEIAQAIQRCFTAKQINVPMIMLMPMYQDMQGLSQEQTNALIFVSNTGIMKGDGQKFRPNDMVKRSELARISNRCSELVEANTEMSKQLDESYNGKTLNIQEGDTFVLSLESNPTTGYSWSLDDSWNKKLLSLAGQGYNSISASNLVGQGGANYWKFKAVQAGTIDLKLYYARPWESVQPLKTFIMKVEIKATEATK